MFFTPMLLLYICEFMPVLGFGGNIRGLRDRTAEVWFRRADGAVGGWTWGLG
jgi:hypothetical protein